jgi:hypothetical protein
LIEVVALRTAAIISRIVAGPSNSSCTWLPAISGTPVACSSSTARAFRSEVALAQRRASRLAAWFWGRAPRAVVTVGLALAGLSGRRSASGRVRQEATTAIRASAASQYLRRCLFILLPW